MGQGKGEIYFYELIFEVFLLKEKEIHYTLFLIRKIFFQKVRLKNPKTLRQCQENLQPQMAELQFLKNDDFS